MPIFSHGSVCEQAHFKYLIQHNYLASRNTHILYFIIINYSIRTRKLDLSCEGPRGQIMVSKPSSET